MACKEEKNVFPLLLLALNLLIFGACQKSKLPYYGTYDFTPQWQVPDHKIDTFSFVSHRGEVVVNKTFQDKIYVANFFFTTCPGICPILTNNLLEVQSEFGEDDLVGIISHTVTPWIDSIPRLEQYADTRGIDKPEWHLVTGDRESLYTIARGSYFADMQDGIPKDVGEFLHTENFVLIDTRGYIRGVYNGTLMVEVNQLIDDIKILKKEG